MEFDPDPPIMAELLHWCLNRKPGRDARRRRVPVLLQEFAGLFAGRWPIITVTGTAGKGSTCALLEAVLIEAGHVPGVMTKPHLVSYRERIRVAGRYVSTPELEVHTRRILVRLRSFVDKKGPAYLPSLYEALLLIGGSIFNERGVTIGVIEAAVGGSNDASSFLPAIVSAITSVHLDHQEDLGDSIEAIARDKAGIANPGGTLVMGAGMSAEARAVVLAENTPRRVRCIQSEVDEIEVLKSGINGHRLRLPHTEVKLPFVGEHQVAHFATVWTLLKVLQEMNIVGNRDAIRGVGQARNPGRFEFLAGRPNWLLDVAHNPASIQALIATAGRFFSPGQIVVILGATEPHDYRSYVRQMEQWGIPIGFCEGFPKAVAVETLEKELIRKEIYFGHFKHPREAVGALRANPLLKEKTVLVTGSLFLVGRWRHELFNLGLLPVKEE